MKTVSSSEEIISEEDYLRAGHWGLLASIDLGGCDRKKISDPREIRRFVIKLCEKIRMVRHREVLIERFGDGDLEGYSFMQFIETSSITAHFDETKNRAFIDVFSCRYFDPRVTLAFCRDFFAAGSERLTVIPR